MYLYVRLLRDIFAELLYFIMKVYKIFVASSQIPTHTHSNIANCVNQNKSDFCSSHSAQTLAKQAAIIIAAVDCRTSSDLHSHANSF